MEIPSTSRSTRIDFLRGVAIMLVLLLHFSLTYDLVDSPLSLILPAKVLRALVSNGNYGVTMFFVISGFLITSNNLRRYQQLGDVRLSEFYLFRFARIIPPLILALLVIVGLGLLGVPSFGNHGAHGMPPSFFLIAVLSVLTFWHNLLMQAVGYFNYCLNIYWSLSVEEMFYLTFPLAGVLFKRRGYVALCVLAIGAGPIYRAFHRDDELFFMYGYAACFDAIAFGCLTALLRGRFDPGGRAGRLLRVLSGAGLAACYGAGIDGHEVMGFTVIALCTACLLVNAFGPAAKNRMLPGRLLCWFGRHSYELYLFHIIVLALMRDAVRQGTLAYGYKLPYLALFLVLSALAAAAVSRWYADPLNAALRTIGARRCNISG
jgi:peptidoglycan/LPS O-acetylase OafA/YrhL